jgi:peptidoglycan/LPS O-acetylase OafA/YrhL
MDLRRLRAGEWVAAVSGVTLLVSLFLPWYGPGSVTGWESLAAIDVLLAFVAAAGVLLAIVTATQGVPAVPIAFSGLLTFVGLFGVVLVLFRVVDLPDGASGREWALWLGLAGAAGITAGAALAMRDERLSPPGRYTDLTGRPGPPPAGIDPISPPRP